MHQPGPTRRTLLRAAGAGLLAYLSPGTALSDPGERVLGEGRSRYNHVRVTERGSVRTMYFVGDDGTQYIETRVDRAYPASLDLDVFRTMMAGFLLAPRPTSALILGLGGGAIANYLHARVAGLELDAVDIDPEVVRLAKAHFDVPREHPRYRCHIADARLFLERAPADRRWDMIFLDAFRGVTVPYHLKTAEFHAAVLARLSPQGVVVANLHNATRMYPHDRATFAAVYPARYAFLSEAGNQTTLVAAADPQRLGPYAVRDNARAAQPSFDFDLLGLAARLYLRRDWPADTPVLRDDFRPDALDTAVLRHNETCIHGCRYQR
ncbi:fused MFS/spermidine synthase [Nannocystis sp.]|uniref:spermidine synthase n=1 Tax=Nannocystis sp. TaxID=1962667 RepID=UPI0024291934|nr:fused MFS/spermidine synthase [Nannocystis sp.]MBK7825192.1 fused MFS/spermidine synthase [Nannocystis sp.]MBK9756948.1 fused MFS/spermidine synthase [Nannocystis sp.]